VLLLMLLGWMAAEMIGCLIVVVMMLSGGGGCGSECDAVLWYVWGCISQGE